MYDKNLCSGGIKKVKDLMTEYGYLQPWENVSYEFRLESLHFMNWFGLLQAIRNNFKSRVKGVHYSGTLECSGVFLNEIFYGLKSVSTEKICDAMIGKKFSQAKCSTIFIRPLKQYISQESVYLLPRLVSIDTRTRIFQYKILGNIIYLNERLCQMKIVPSPLPSLCAHAKETVMHLFSGCDITIKLRGKIRERCRSTLNLPNVSV